MKRIIKWFLLSLAGIILLLLVGIILCKTVLKDSILKYYNDSLYDERVELLRTTEYKQSDDNLEFSCRPDSASVAKISNYFRLDTVTDNHGDTWDKSIAIAKIICGHIPHENQKVEPKNKTAIGLWEYCNEFGSGINCKYHSIMLHEMLNAIGIQNRIVWSMPMDSTDRDCHVVNHVWLPEYGKWAMLDSDMNTFITGTDGLPMSIPEIREALINHNQCDEFAILPSMPRANFYKADLSKNLYWFEMPKDAGFNLYDNPLNYYRLLPVGFKGFRDSQSSCVSTTDNEKFWAKP